MKLELFDKVALTTGETASIVEVLGKGAAFVADIDRSDGSTDTDFIYPEQIKEKI